MKAVTKDIFREIRATRSRFFSIFLLAMLGVAFLAGLKTSAPSMKTSVSQYYDEQALMDVRLTSTLGLTAEDVAAARAQSGVAYAEGAYAIDAFADMGGSEYVAKLHSGGGELNVPAVREGRMPESANECAVEPTSLAKLSIGIGDTVTLRASDGAYSDFIADGEYTVVGIIDSPLYISLERGSSTLGSGKVDLYFYLSESAFKSEYYTDVVLTLEGAKGLNRYGDEYTALVDAALPALEDFIDGRTALRHDALYSDARAELDSGWEDYAAAESDAASELQSAEQQLKDSRAELDAGWDEYNAGMDAFNAQIAEGRSELETGWQQYYSAKRQVEAARAELEANKSAAETQIAAAQTEIKQNKQLLAQSKTQLDEAALTLAAFEQKIAALTGQSGREAELSEAQAQYDALKAEYDAGLEAYNAGLSQIEAAEAQIDDTRAQLSAAEREVTAAEREIAATEAQLYSVQQLLDAPPELNALLEAKQKLDDGETEYKNGLADYNDAKAEAEQKLSDAKRELEDGEAELRGLDSGAGYALDLTQTAGFSSFGDDADRVGALANVFPIIFFLVAALVCLTTMTRMVDEQRGEIGALKALGYSKWSVVKKYIVYALLASLGGSVAGIFLGCWVIPKVIFTAYGILYTMPKMVLRLPPELCVFSVLAAVFSTTVAAFAAAAAALRASPAELMRPRAPKPGKRVLLERIGFIWNRLSFIKKVTARNLFRYKKRLLMTIIGIGGCTALLITGFGLQDSIFAIISRQFEDVSKYDLTAVMDPQSSESDLYDAVKLISADDRVSGCLPAYQNSITLAGNRRTASAYVFAVEDAADMDDYIILRSRSGDEHYTLDTSGAIITEKLSELLGLRVGDTLELDSAGHSVKITAIAENYIYHYIYMSAESYAEVYGEPWSPNCFLLRSSDGEQATSDALSEKLIATGTVLTVSNLKGMANSFTDSLNVVNYAVLVIIISAAALAFVVLYNLTNINITERKRELATIKVLGFYDREVSRYVYRENVVLTLMGMVLGVGLGYLLHSWLVRTVEVDMVMFGRTADASSYLYSLALTLVFSFLVNLAAHWRLKKIDMVESLKTVE